MFNEEANIAGAIQAFFNKQVDSLESAAQLYNIDLAILEARLTPAPVSHTQQTLDEVLPNVD